MPRSPALLIPPLLALAGCANNDPRYPSLLPRSIETTSVVDQARPDPIAAPDPALDRRIATMVAAVDKASGEFNAAAQKTEAVIATTRGAAEGTQAWLDAQTALADVAAQRAPLATALADLQQLAIERGAAALPRYPALDTAVERTQKLSDTQAKRVASLEAELSAK